MPRDEAKAVEAAIVRLRERFATEPHLLAEMHRARRQFFGSDRPIPAAVRGATDAAEQRFAEWFALERESEVLGAVPIELPRYAADNPQLVGSMVGVLLVQDVDDGRVEARDLQDDEILELAVPLASLQIGDLLVGRLFAEADGGWTPSAAAAVFRPGVSIGEAFRRDIERVGLERRLFQVEIEHLLLRRADQTPSPTAEPVTGPDGVPLEHLEAQLEALLQKTEGRHSATAVSQLLADADRPGQVMGPLLEELAFETSVDLDATRRLLLRIWNAWHADAPETGAPTAASPAPGETLGEQLVRTLDEGLRKKHDVDELFAQLERMAGLEPGASDEGDNPFDHEGDDDDGDDDDDAHDDRDDDRDDDEESEATAAGAVPGDPLPGDLGPLVQEFLWETGREPDESSTPLRLLVELQGNAAVPNTDLETVTGQDLMRLLLHCYLGAAPDRRVAAVQTAWTEVQRFYDWAQKVQEVDLSGVLQQCRGGLVDQLERLQAAGLALSTGAASGAPGILAVEDVRASGFGVRDDEGADHWIAAPATTTALLRVGDLLLGVLAPSGKTTGLRGLVVALPSDARTLME